MSLSHLLVYHTLTVIQHENTIRFVTLDGRQFLLQCPDAQQLHEWLSRINYASAFKSAGVRMRPLGMSGKDVELTGVAAATSHLHDMQHINHGTPKVRNWDNRDIPTPHDLMGMLSPESEASPTRPLAKRRITILNGRDDLDLDAPAAPEIDGADQFKATFDEVKAELAAGNWASIDDESPCEDTPTSNGAPALISPASIRGQNSPLPSRSQIIQSKVRDLESKLSAAQTQLDSDLRIVRNIGMLTPFQRSTRDRLSVAVQGVAKRVMQVRIDIERLVCYRDVLSTDLMAEGRDWSRAKKIALKAATDTLQSRANVSLIPRMTLSFPDSPPSRVPEKHDSSSSQRRDSTGDSFHSAMEFGTEWPSADDLAPTFLSTAQTQDLSPQDSSSASLGSYPFPETEAGLSQSLPRPSLSTNPSSARSSRTSDELGGTHEKYYTALESPEAVDWDETRCAQRVSLVRVPSDFRLSTRFRGGKKVSNRSSVV